MMTRFPHFPPARTVAVLLGLLLAIAGAAQAGAKPARGYLGVTLQGINPSMAKALQIDEGVGVLVVDVIDDGPAAASGLEAGDVILSFEGEEITSDNPLRKAVRAVEPGRTVSLGILHDGERQQVQVELGEAKDHARVWSWSSKDGKAPHAEFFGEDGDHDIMVFKEGDDEGNVWVTRRKGPGRIDLQGLKMQTAYLGVGLGDLNEQLGEYFGVEDGEGALVNLVREDTPAAAAGLRAGDVIVKVGDEEIEDAGDVHAAMADFEPGDEVEIAFVRKGDRKTAKATLAEMPEGAYGFRAGHSPLMHRFGHDFAPDVDFPEGFDHDVRVVVPKAPRTLHRVIRIDDEEDLSELREELQEMQVELKKLKEELKKDSK